MPLPLPLPRAAAAASLLRLPPPGPRPGLGHGLRQPLGGRGLLAAGALLAQASAAVRRRPLGAGGVRVLLLPGAVQVRRGRHGDGGHAGGPRRRPATRHLGSCGSALGCRTCVLAATQAQSGMMLATGGVVCAPNQTWRTLVPGLWRQLRPGEERRPCQAGQGREVVQGLQQGSPQRLAIALCVGPRRQLHRLRSREQASHAAPPSSTDGHGGDAMPTCGSEVVM